jgi:hypothetical protein
MIINITTHLFLNHVSSNFVKYIREEFVGTGKIIFQDKSYFTGKFRRNKRSRRIM